MMFFRWIYSLSQKTWSKWFPARYKVREMQGDNLPKKIPKNTIIHLIDEGESWSVGFLCPCGCGDTLELMLLPNVKPHWTLTLDDNSTPTLFPSIWRKSGCGSHFWLKNGIIYWCM